MAMKRCPNGHYYDSSQHVSCPYCGVQIGGADMRGGGPFMGPSNDVTVKLSQEPPAVAPKAPSFDDIKTIKKRDDELKTIGKAQSMMGFRPLAGWLVCINGPDKGSDYRIYYERNFIGRAPNMDIAIKKDQGISRVNHAVISYDPKNKIFKLSDGDGRSMLYVNGEAVESSAKLKHGDIIETADTKLMFIPCCGEWFSW